jgi:hypothetical protein
MLSINKIIKKLMLKLYIVVKFDFSYEGQVFYGLINYLVGKCQTCPQTMLVCIF